MMMAQRPEVVGVLRKKPGQNTQPRVPPLDPQETKIRGDLYVEDLGERRIVSVRMGWLWVEGTSMNLPLRTLNLRQAAPSICQPHELALGFTLSTSQGDTLATFWADTEPIYWSWVRAIAAELIRQTPFGAQRCLNFLEILTTCPRGPFSPDSPNDSRRRSRSELRYWPSDSLCDKGSIEDNRNTTCILDESRRRARSEFRGWSSSNSSDEDLLGEFRNAKNLLQKHQQPVRTWGCSESSEGSDDSLSWVGSRSGIDVVDYPKLAYTREQRIQQYKEVRRREYEARSKRILEEDARKRKEENNNNNNNNEDGAIKSRYASRTKSRCFDKVDNSCRNRRSDDQMTSKLVPKPMQPVTSIIHPNWSLPSFDDSRNNNLPTLKSSRSSILKADATERRSRARERISIKKRSEAQSELVKMSLTSSKISCRGCTKVEPEVTLVPMNVPEKSKAVEMLPLAKAPCEEDLARLLERCQRVDHYVPVRDKLTLFESLSRMGGRLARSTEDLGRTFARPSPRGKQRARSLHDLNRGLKSVPVREMCRFFEGERDQPTAAHKLVWNHQLDLSPRLTEFGPQRTRRTLYIK